MKHITYKDKVSGETLYVIKNISESGKVLYTGYHKDPDYQIAHREDGPAEKWADGEEYWLQNNRYHRLNGPAYIGVKKQYQSWFVDGVKIDLDALTIMQEKLTK